MNQQRLHAVVYGRVQGVSFRYATLRQANALRLTGWVRNRADRAVEVMAEGPRADLDEFVEFLRAGPPAARVDDVVLEWSPARGDFHSFDITG